MFHDGDLQSGIAAAIQQSKSVVCFVQDDGDDSTIWHSWLLEDNLQQALTGSAVVLRLQARSQEAGFLSAFCPVDSVPTLVVIHNGQLKEHLKPGIEQEAFTQRLRSSLDATSSTTSGQQAPQASPPSAALPTTTTTSATSTQPTASTSVASTMPSSRRAALTNSSSTEQYQAILRERAARLEADKQLKDEQEAAEASARKEKAKGKQRALDEEIEAASGPDGARKKAQMSAAAQARMARQVQKSELERVLAMVEADKRARRAKEEEKRMLRRQQQEEAGIISEEKNVPVTRMLSRGPASACQLQIRMFDGSTLRSQFPAACSLKTDVRPWVDESLSLPDPAAKSQKKRKIPAYTFKQILTPLPNKSLSAGDEEQTLQTLELLPSATLVLVPVQSYTEAYNAEGSGMMGQFYASIMGFLLMLWEMLKSLTGVGHVRPNERAPSSSLRTGGISGSGQASGSEKAQQASVKFRTLRDDDPRRNQEFYNGNSLDFEPRKDDDEKKDK